MGLSCMQPLALPSGHVCLMLVECQTPLQAHVAPAADMRHRLQAHGRTRPLVLKHPAVATAWLPALPLLLPSCCSAQMHCPPLHGLQCSR